MLAGSVDAHSWLPFQAGGSLTVGMPRRLRRKQIVRVVVDCERIAWFGAAFNVGSTSAKAGEQAGTVAHVVVCVDATARLTLQAGSELVF
jgi:hypothetical protein